MLAWARLGDGGWGVLLAWAGGWRGVDRRQVERPRWGWCRLIADLVKAQRPRRYEDPAHRWHGHWEGSVLEEAVEHAAIDLPRELRAAALTPRWTMDPANGRDPETVQGKTRSGQGPKIRRG